jgi:hypothetical protein
MAKDGRNTGSITPSDVPRIKKRLLDGDYQHLIAADYQCNQGRISEINTGKRFAEIAPEA